MKMQDIQIGMKLKSPLAHSMEGVITVTELTSNGFKYDIEAPYSLGARYGVVLKSGHEHFGINGESFYEPLK